METCDFLCEKKVLEKKLFKEKNLWYHVIHKMSHKNDKKSEEPFILIYVKYLYFR